MVTSIEQIGNMANSFTIHPTVKQVYQKRWCRKSTEAAGIFKTKSVNRQSVPNLPYLAHKNGGVLFR